jgi:hypothetical protein
MNIKTKYPLSKLTFGCEPLGGADWGKIDISEIYKLFAKLVLSSCSIYSK